MWSSCIIATKCLLSNQTLLPVDATENSSSKPFSLTRRIYSDTARANREYLRLGSPHQWRNFTSLSRLAVAIQPKTHTYWQKNMKNQCRPRYRVFIRVCGFLIARGQRLCLLSLVSSLSSGEKRQSLYRDLLKLWEVFFFFFNLGWTCCGIFSMVSYRMHLQLKVRST